MRTLLRLIVIVAALFALYALADRLWPQAMARLTLATEHALGGLQERRVSIDGIDYAYLDSGEAGGETLVLLHGFGADKDHFALVSIFLSGVGRIIAVDLPGFGASSKPIDADYTIAAQTERVRQFLAALKLPRVHLGGSSMGGAIALEFARRFPERVGSLWLLAPAGVLSARDSEMIRRYRASGESPLIARTPEQFAAVMDIALGQPPPTPYSVKHELALAAAANAPLHTRIFHDMVAAMPAFERSAAGLGTPALIVWGERDRVLDVSGASILHQALPNSRLIIMPGIGHLPMLEAPQRSARDYRRFRASLPAEAQR